MFPGALPPTLLVSQSSYGKSKGHGLLLPVTDIKSKGATPSQLDFGTASHEQQVVDLAGRANPRSEFVRAGVARPPQSRKLASELGLPLGLVVQPLAPSSVSLPVVNWGVEEG